MKDARVWTLGSIILIIAVVAGTWFLGMSPKLEEAATANEDRRAEEAHHVVQETTIAALKEQFEKIDELTAERDVLKRAVPGEANLAALIGEINSKASASGIHLTSLSFGDPVGWVPQQTEPEDPELASAIATAGTENFLMIPVDMSITGEYQQAMSFVNRMQLGDRLMLVHGLTLNDGQAVTSQPVEFSIRGQVFVLLGASAVAEPVATEETVAE